MAKKKTIRHMGMTMTEEEHRRWHQEHDGKKLTPSEHRKLMKSLSIGEEEDRKWHEGQEGLASEDAAGTAKAAKPVNCFAIGGGFLAYCVRQGWLSQEKRGRSTKYFVTEAGREALAEFGITKY